MVKEVITLPHTSLRKRSKQIGHISDKTVELINDMEKSTLDWEDKRDHEVGVALAAVQINYHKRVIVIRNNFDNKKDRTFTAYINPEIIEHEGDPEYELEGCLSVKELYGKVPRYPKVKVRAKTVNGDVVEITAEHFLARVFQHEIDHMNGVLFVDRIKDSPESFSRLREDGNITKLGDEEREETFSILWK